mmetsp:Transcript_74336/g.187296  ORF Transcript_74336/g.187296 Transcript_74336/m.187296 type:complete len:279 (-) Transcript_74336:41-877(-)
MASNPSILESCAKDKSGVDNPDCFSSFSVGTLPCKRHAKNGTILQVFRLQAASRLRGRKFGRAILLEELAQHARVPHEHGAAGARRAREQLSQQGLHALRGGLRALADDVPLLLTHGADIDLGRRPRRAEQPQLLADFGGEGRAPRADGVAREKAHEAPLSSVGKHYCRPCNARQCEVPRHHGAAERRRQSAGPRGDRNGVGVAEVPGLLDLGAQILALLHAVRREAMVPFADHPVETPSLHGDVHPRLGVPHDVDSPSIGGYLCHAANSSRVRGATT